MASSSSYYSDHQNIYADLYKPAVIIAGCFSVVAIILSIFLILRHLRSYNNPSEQIWVVVVVFMVPVYATESAEVVNLEEGDSTQAVVENKETQVEAPGTSVTESVQDIVLEGGHHIVKDVVLTINQAIGPVEKIRETFHQSSDDQDDKSEVEVEARIEVTLSDDETHMAGPLRKSSLFARFKRKL